MQARMSEEGVPLQKPVVRQCFIEWERVSSQPRVKPFLRTSDLRYTISINRSVPRAWKGIQGREYGGGGRPHLDPKHTRRTGPHNSWIRWLDMEDLKLQS